MVIKTPLRGCPIAAAVPLKSSLLTGESMGGGAKITIGIRWLSNHPPDTSLPSTGYVAIAQNTDVAVLSFRA